MAFAFADNEPLLANRLAPPNCARPSVTIPDCTNRLAEPRRVLLAELDSVATAFKVLVVCLVVTPRDEIVEVADKDFATVRVLLAELDNVAVEGNVILAGLTKVASIEIDAVAFNVATPYFAFVGEAITVADAERVDTASAV